MRQLAIEHTRPPALLRASRTLAAALAFAAVTAFAQTAFAQTAPAAPPSSYFVFGTVVALTQRSVDIQTFNEARQRTVQYGFALTRETRADVVHVGDTVEVIYQSAGTQSSGADWIVLRLIVLSGGIPRAGAPTAGSREVPAPVGARIAPPPSTARVPSAATVTHGDAKSAAQTSASQSVAMQTPPTGGPKSPPPAATIDLGVRAKPKPPTLVDVPLDAPDAVNVKPVTTKDVAVGKPAEECNRSDADWPTRPLRLLVLDFRYPTEREESHDIGTTGGGSGTAVADLIYSSLDDLNQFAMMRGDRTRLYRADFAGAARVGRELGADAVLAGTFAPVDLPPNADPDAPTAPKSYELRAGVVDTCTGQLLLRLTSVTCSGGADPNQPANAALCKRFSVTAKQASDPRDQAKAFKAPIDALLFPLEHNGPAPGTLGSAGVVSAADNGSVTIKLAPGSKLKPGDKVALHAWRLTKNPTTYTLRNLHDEEIGSVTISSVQGGTATGAYTGDFPPHPGDTAELVADQP